MTTFFLFLMLFKEQRLHNPAPTTCINYDTLSVQDIKNTRLSCSLLLYAYYQIMYTCETCGCLIGGGGWLTYYYSNVFPYYYYSKLKNNNKRLRIACLLNCRHVVSLESNIPHSPYKYYSVFFRYTREPRTWYSYTILPIMFKRFLRFFKKLSQRCDMLYVAVMSDKKSKITTVVTAALGIILWCAWWFFTGYFLFENWRELLTVFLLKNNTFLLAKPAHYIKVTIVIVGVQYHLMLLLFRLFHASYFYPEMTDRDSQFYIAVTLLSWFAALFIYFIFFYNVYLCYIHVHVLRFLDLINIWVCFICLVFMQIILVLLRHYTATSGTPARYLLLCVHAVCALIAFSVGAAWLANPIYNSLLEAFVLTIYIQEVHVGAATVFLYILLITLLPRTNKNLSLHEHDVTTILFFTLAFGARIGFNRNNAITCVLYNGPMVFATILILFLVILTLIYFMLLYIAKRLNCNYKAFSIKSKKIFILLLAVVLTFVAGVLLSVLCFKYGIGWI